MSASVRVEELDDDVGNNSGSPGGSTNGTDKARIAWVEVKDIHGLYPALAEAIRNLHSLPFEING